MFEEVAIWKRVNATVAVRYVGFRNLNTDSVWIAFGNYVGLNDDKDLNANELIAAQATLEAILTELPEAAEMWRPTVADAVAFFISNNPDG